MKRALGTLVFCSACLPGAALAQDYGLEAGGLTPPPTIETDPTAPTPNQTEANLQRAEEEDSGRGLEFVWLNAEVGAEHLGLQTFKANNLVDAEVVETEQTGLVFGGGAGFRLVFLTLGARFRLGNFSAWQLWTLDAEAGLRIPLGSVEPYFTFAGGYASMGSFDSKNIGTDLNSAGVDVTGFNLRIGGGLDVYLGDVFSIGGNFTAEALFLSRPEVDPEQLASGGMGGTLDDVYAADGSSIGAGVTVTAVVGLHF